MASRYDGPSGAGTGAGQDMTVITQDSGGTVNTQGSSATNTQELINSQEQYQQQTQNMTPEQLAALNGLIQQLLGGGTQSMAEQRANLLAEINAVRNLRGGYSKENAFADAQGAMNQQLRQTLEKLMPSIVRAAEGSGTSANSMRALLMQEAASKAAESASSLGLKAAVDYGGLSGNFSQVLANLVSQTDPVSKALLDALGIAKGSVQNTSGTKESTTEKSGSSTTNSSQTQTTSPGTQTKIIDYANDIGSGSGGSSLLGYSPSNTDSLQSSLSSYSGSNADYYGIPGSGSSVSALYDANGNLTIGPVDPYASYVF